MKLVIFGLGKFYEEHKDELFNGDSIVAYLDNSRFIESEYNGCPIYSPDKINSITFDIILVMTNKYYEEIKKQLVAIGVPDCKITNLRIYKQKGVLHQYFHIPKVPSANKKALIIIDELAYQGGSVAVCYAARALQNVGVYVEVLCYRPNFDFIREQLGYGLIINVYENLMDASLEELWFLNRFDVVLVNTLQMSVFAKFISNKIKTFLWIHEPRDYYTIHASIVQKMQQTGYENVNVLTVSSVADDSFHTYFPDVKTTLMYYGIEDVLDVNNKNPNILKENNDIKDSFAMLNIQKDKTVIATVANVCKRKAQDLFAQAVTLLSDEEKEQCYFLIIGRHYEKEVDDVIDECMKKNNSLYSIGQLSRQQLISHLSDIDIFVCPSREDPLPICVTEGFSAGKICIVSDKTGSANLIVPHKNGLVCAPDAQSICNEIRWCLQNKDKWNSIKEASRKIYDDEFSLDIFGKKLSNILFKD